MASFHEENEFENQEIQETYHVDINPRQQVSLNCDTTIRSTLTGNLTLDSKALYVQSHQPVGIGYKSMGRNFQARLHII